MSYRWRLGWTASWYLLAEEACQWIQVGRLAMCWLVLADVLVLLMAA